MYRFKKAVFSVLILQIPAILLSLSGCGGGGGGSDDYIGAATVELQVSPTMIDTADRMLVRARLGEVNDNGLALKFRYPLGLNYVPSSSSLTADNQSMDISPSVNLVEGNFRYLVYYIPQSFFGKNKRGTVELLLEGVSRVLQGEVQVDADVDNPLIDNSSEFDSKNPDFAAEDFVEVKVAN